jgi:hypothetical protein
VFGVQHCRLHQSGDPGQQGCDHRNADRRGKTDDQRPRRAHGEGSLPEYERDAKPSDRPELRTHNHGADDQDRLVEQDADAGDQGRDL